MDDMLHPPPPPGTDTPDASPDGDGEWFAAPGPTEITGSVWPHVEEAIVDRVLAHRSTIVFANSRRLAERLTGRLNEIYAERLGTEPAVRTVPAAMMAQAGASAGAPPELAKAHHGSVSKSNARSSKTG